MDPKTLSEGDTAYRQDREVEVVREFDGMNTVVEAVADGEKIIINPASLTPAEDYEPPEPETDEELPSVGEPLDESAEVPDDVGSAGGEELPEFEDAEIDPEEVADELENPDQEMALEVEEEDDVVSCETCGEEFREEDYDNPEKVKAGHMNKH